VVGERGRMFKEQMRHLIDLQKVDSSIFQIEKEKEEIAKKIRLEEERIRLKEADFQKKTKEYELILRDLRSKERKLQKAESDLEHFQGRLYEIKTQKEMKALDHEIEIVKAEKARLEDKILDLMERSEELSKEVKAQGEDLDKGREELLCKKKSFERELANHSRELERLKEKRGHLIGVINENLLSYYDKLLKNKDHLAVVPVRDEVCQGCFITIPPQVVNEIKECFRLITCENCLRILCIEEN
jgi:hypothetical protein